MIVQHSKTSLAIVGFVSSFQFIDPILNVTNKEVLTEEEVLQCRQVIYSIVQLETKHEPLALPIGHRYVRFWFDSLFNSKLNFLFEIFFQTEGKQERRTISFAVGGIGNFIDC